MEYWILFSMDKKCLGKCAILSIFCFNCFKVGIDTYSSKCIHDSMFCFLAMHLVASLSILWQDYAIMEVAAAVVVNLYTIVGVWPKPLYVMVGILRKKNIESWIHLETCIRRGWGICIYSHLKTIETKYA